MDCFFHHAVPSIALCTGCRKPVCATCRASDGACPSCVLAARIDAAKRANMINGNVGPSSGTYAGAGPSSGPYAGAGPFAGAGAYWAPPPGAPPPPPPGPQAGPPNVQYQHSAAVATCRPETRALVALSYPFWPLALIALLDSRGSHFVKRQAWQALGFNFGMYGIGALLSAIAAVPLLGLGAMPLLPFVIPVTIVASVVYSFRVWQGDDVNVPVVSDWVDARLPAEHA